MSKKMLTPKKTKVLAIFSNTKFQFRVTRKISQLKCHYQYLFLIRLTTDPMFLRDTELSKQTFDIPSSPRLSQLQSQPPQPSKISPFTSPFQGYTCTSQHTLFSTNSLLFLNKKATLFFKLTQDIRAYVSLHCQVSLSLSPFLLPFPFFSEPEKTPPSFQLLPFSTDVLE